MSTHTQSQTPQLAVINQAALAYFRQQLNLLSISSWQEQNAVFWGSQFVDAFHGETLNGVSLGDLKRFLNLMATDHRLSDEGRREVVESLRLFYRTVAGHEPAWLHQLEPDNDNQKSQQNQLSRSAVRIALPKVEYRCQLPVALIYGAGLKISECVRLRTGDILFDEQRIVVRDAQGHITHKTVLPSVLIPALKEHMENRRLMHLKDANESFHGAPVPPALSKDGKPCARSWRLQFVFPDYQTRVVDGQYTIRSHMNEQSIEKAITMAADRVDLQADFNANNLRISFAQHLVQRGVKPTVLKYVLGLLASTPESYNNELQQLSSPLDNLWPWGTNPWHEPELREPELAA